MKIENISLNDWSLSGQGGTAESYYHKTDNNIMLKLFTGDATAPDYAKQEFNFAKNAEKCGLNISKALKLVRCQNRYGIIYQRLQNKKSFSRLCADNPDNIEKYAKEFARAAKKLHNTKSKSTTITSRAEQLTKISNNPRHPLFVRKKIQAFLKQYPDTKTCLHGDLQSGNLVKSHGKNYWIDLGAFAYGNPIYDLACMCFFYNFLPGQLYASTILHMNIKQLKRFWCAFIDEYLSSMDTKAKANYLKQIKSAMFIFLAYTSDYEDHSGFEGFAMKYGVTLMALIA